MSAVVSCTEPISPKLFGDLREMANPGTAHERLQPLIGRWALTAAYRLTPSAKPASARGEAEHRWILGGRFVLQRIRLKARFQEFEGLGIWGYDNYSGRYVANWVVNFDSGISNIDEHWDDAAKSLVLDVARGRRWLDAIDAGNVDWRRHPYELLPVNVATIAVHQLTGLLLALAWVLEGAFGAGP